MCIATAFHNFKLVKIIIIILFNLWTSICKSWYLDSHFIFNHSDLTG